MRAGLRKNQLILPPWDHRPGWATLSLSFLPIPSRTGCRSRRSAPDRMRCSGSRDLYNPHICCPLSDGTGSLFKDSGGAGPRRVCCFSPPVSCSLLNPSFLPTLPPSPLSLFLSLSLCFLLFLPLSPCPSLWPCLPPCLFFPSPPLLLHPFTVGRTSERLPGGGAAHPLRHLPLSGLNVKRPF